MATAVLADTEEQINKQFAVQPGGKLIVEVDFGSIDLNTNASNEVVVDVERRVKRSSKSEEETFLRDHPVTFSPGYSRNLVGGEKKEEKVFKMKTLGRPWFQSSVLG
jgi:hypothetical protein